MFIKMSVTNQLEINEMGKIIIEQDFSSCRIVAQPTGGSFHRSPSCTTAWRCRSLHIVVRKINASLNKNKQLFLQYFAN